MTSDRYRTTHDGGRGEDPLMNIRLTGPMQKVMTPELLQRIHRTLDEFPELEGHTLTVGLVVNSMVHGNADSRDMVIRLNTRERSGMTYFTIAHEVTHLLQRPGLGTVPNGEIQCDIFRSEEHTSELQSLRHLVCRLLLEKKKIK